MSASGSGMKHFSELSKAEAQELMVNMARQLAALRASVAILASKIEATAASLTQLVEAFDELDADMRKR